MGQKVNPHGMRVGIIKDWESRWYADGEFADYLSEDHKIRKFLKKRLYNAGVSRIEIDRASDGAYYLVIHSGSRNLGKQVAEFYQKLAVKLDKGYDDYLTKRDELIRTYKEQGRKKEIQKNS